MQKDFLQSNMAATMKIRSISIDASVTDLAEAIRSSGGALLVTGFPQRVPFGDIQSGFDYLSERDDVTSRLNRAYTKNLVYKDAYKMGNGGPSVDMKRVLDLSPERLQAIASVDPSLSLHEGALGSALDFWENLRADFAPKLVDAVGRAIGCPEDVKADSAYNYRMINYYERDVNSIPPRCGEHRDFGTFTLIFASHHGLQLFVDGEWVDVDATSNGENVAIMLFGWCTQIRSNGRIPALLHRVTDPAPYRTCADGGTVVVPRRTSAVLFCAPKQHDTPLEPVLLRENEERIYVSGVKTGQLRGCMARKWRQREGTNSPEDRIHEEWEILVSKMKTQDDVIAKTVAVATPGN